MRLLTTIFPKLKEVRYSAEDVRSTSQYVSFGRRKYDDRWKEDCYNEQLERLGQEFYDRVVAELRRIDGQWIHEGRTCPSGKLQGTLKHIVNGEEVFKIYMDMYFDTTTNITIKGHTTYHVNLCDAPPIIGKLVNSAIILANQTLN